MKGTWKFFRRLPHRFFFALWFIFGYTRVKLRANLRVSWDVLRPTPRLSPGVIAYPLTIQGDLEIFLLSGLLTMIPATLSMDLSEDRSTLYIHGLYIDDQEQFIQEIHRDLEIPIMEFCQ